MADALIGIPQDYTVTSTRGSNIAFVTNDEPGLTFSDTIASPNVIVIDMDVTDIDPISAIAILGQNAGAYASGKVSFMIQAATTAANRTAGTFAYTSQAFQALSTNRTAAQAKSFMQFAARTERFWRLTVTALGAAVAFQPWRILLCKVIQPQDSLDAGASAGVDDRSDRRYSRSGRRVIDPTVVVPTFQGTWSLLDEATMKQDFRPLMYKRAGTFPVLFLFDPADTVWGEDSMIYGDLEKAQTISYDEGLNYSFSFGIVAIAP